MNDHPKHNPRLRQTVIVAVCVLAVLLFLYLLLRDRPGSASDYLDDSAPYTFDSSASRTFRTVDSRLAVVSSSGLQLLDENGKTVLHEIFTLSQPGISVGGERVCAYDIGGTTLCVADFKGNKTDIEPAGEIISADLSDSGYLAVCSDAAGYKGAVTVYDTSGKAVYVWYSGTGYLVRAAVSPDGKYLAALCLQDSGRSKVTRRPMLTQAALYSSRKGANPSRAKVYRGRSKPKSVKASASQPGSCSRSIAAPCRASEVPWGRSAASK